MLEALVSGADDPQALAELAKGKLRQKRPELAEALQGLMGSHQRLLLQSQLRHLGFVDQVISQMNQEVTGRMEPFDDAITRLDEIAGIGRRTAEDVLAEIGVDMSRFPTAGHLASWAHVCPGNHESAGKRKSGGTGRGNPWLRAAPVGAARAAARTKKSYFSAHYHRLAARRGGKWAALAVAHTLLITIYHLLNRGTEYEDLASITLISDASSKQSAEQ